MSFLKSLKWLETNQNINPHTPVAQKIADEVVFDVSKVKESSFFKSDLTNPLC